jgi:hypothetical protein
VEKIEAKMGIRLVRYPYAKVEEWRERLEAVWNPSRNEPLRPLSREEQAFIANERLMSMLDFRYWVERYWTVEIDGVMGGGIGPMRLGESQEILLRIIAKAQEEEADKVKRGETADGILIADHKARQVWHTALCRALCMHRATQIPNSRCVAGSVDDEKIQILYDRDTLGYNHLPWYLKPNIVFNEKNEHISFGIGSKVTYMISSKKSSFGQGTQNDFGHITEVSEFFAPLQLEIDFFPTFPQSPDTLLVLESRANGRRGWWREFTELVRHGRKKRWRYCFIPWYAESRKYRRTPPPDWKPSEVAMLHAKKVYETSAEFVGKPVYLPKEQLYWWETTREEYRVSGNLSSFLTNYCATPEESFQHAGQSAFGPEVLDELRLRTRKGRPYEFSTEREEGQTITIPNCGYLRPMREQELDGDPRGIVWMYEDPQPNAQYFVGVDPTKGIVGWSRAFRTDADASTDNGVIQVIRKGRDFDTQVAEYASPIDPEDLGDIANALGRLYCGSSEDGQAMQNIEVWPGPGEPTQRRLITKYGYTNLYVPIKYANTLVPERGRNIAGWTSNQRSRRELWRLGTKHVTLGRIRLCSEALIEEMADCESDDYLWTETARARYGKHDDRVIALFLAIYAAHDWGQEVETKNVEVQTQGSADWQASDISAERLHDAWNDRLNELLE